MSSNEYSFSSSKIFALKWNILSVFKIQSWKERLKYFSVVKYFLVPLYGNPGRVPTVRLKFIIPKQRSQAGTSGYSWRGRTVKWRQIIFFCQSQFTITVCVCFFHSKVLDIRAWTYFRLSEGDDLIIFFLWFLNISYWQSVNQVYCTSNHNYGLSKHLSKFCTNCLTDWQVKLHLNKQINNSDLLKTLFSFVVVTTRPTCVQKCHPHSRSKNVIIGPIIF